MEPLRPRVLLVDNEPTILSTLRRRLESRFQLVVLFATTQRAARALVGEAPFDGAVVDLLFGDNLSLDVLAILRERRPEASLALVAGHGAPHAQLNRVAEIGALVLHKPFEPANLGGWETGVREAFVQRRGSLALLEGADSLSPRERESLELRLRGLGSREVAECLRIAVSTERKLVQRGLWKLSSRSVMKLRARIEGLAGATSGWHEEP